MTGEVAGRFVHAVTVAAGAIGGGDDAPVRLARRFGLEGFVRRLVGLPDVDEGTAVLRRLEERVVLDTAVEVHHILDSASVPHFFFKGAALVPLLYRPGDRVTADVDCHVSPAHVREALTALGHHGFVPRPDREQSGPASLRAGVILTQPDRHEAETVDIDLHWAVEPLDRLLPRGTVHLPQMVWDHIHFDGEIPAPSAPDHVVLLVHHLVHHDLLHVRGLLDLALLWERFPLTGEHLEHVADHLSARHALRAFAEMLRRDFGLAVPSGLGPVDRGWRGRRVLDATRLDHWLTWAGRADHAQHARITRERFFRRVWLSDRLASVWTLAADAIFPPVAFLRWRWPATRTLGGAWARHIFRVAEKAGGVYTLPERLPTERSG